MLWQPQERLGGGAGWGEVNRWRGGGRSEAAREAGKGRGGGGGRRRARGGRQDRGKGGEKRSQVMKKTMNIGPEAKNTRKIAPKSINKSMTIDPESKKQ